MASRILDKVINDAQTAAVASAPRAGTPRGQVFDAQGNRLATGQYTQKRYDAAGNELPESRAWINVGRVMKLPDMQGNMVKRFVNVASGIPVDSIPQFKASPNNKLRQKQNKERKSLLALIDEMQPGEERVLHYQVRIRKVFDQSAIELENDDDEDDFQLSSPVNDLDEDMGETETE